MAVRDLIGKRGESIVSARLLDFCGNPLPYFDPHPLGEKCPTYDYLVELIGAGGSVPYFLVQVKTTQGHTQGSLKLKVAVKSSDVKKMVGCPIPTYLIGVDEPAEAAYVVAVAGTLKGGISSIPAKYPLNASNLKVLWDEVIAYWAGLGNPCKKSAFTF